MSHLIDELEQRVPNGAGIIEITPEVANQILLNHSNKANRALRLRHRDALAADMRAGKWRTTHQGIAFSRSRILLDGHHRLSAIIQAGVPVRLWVFFYQDEDAFETIDYHLAQRTIRDIMAIRHYQRDGGRKMDAGTVDPLSYIAYNQATTRAKPTLWEVERLYVTFKTEIDEINGALGGDHVKAKGRTAAPVKAALILRLYHATPSHREYLLDQWRAFVRLAYDDMDPTTQALLRRMDSGGSARGSTLINERAASAWIGFGPDRGLTKLQYRKLDAHLAALREATSQALVATAHPRQGERDTAAAN